MAAREIISDFFRRPDHFYPPRCHLSPSWCHYLYFCTHFCTIYIFAENNPAFSCHRFIIFKLQRILFLNCSEIASTFKFFDARNSSPSQSWLFFSFMRSWNIRQNDENIERKELDWNGLETVKTYFSRVWWSGLSPGICPGWSPSRTGRRRWWRPPATRWSDWWSWWHLAASQPGRRFSFIKVWFSSSSPSSSHHY